jgi:hypothetical protein
MTRMAPSKTIEDGPTTLSFDTFWTWLQAHPNCIVRAGTPDAVLYDHDDLHWHFTSEGTDTMVVQAIRGKNLVGEIVVVPAEVAYVQKVAAEEDEYVFELVSESKSERVSAYYFVLSHGYEAQGGATPGRAVH